MIEILYTVAGTVAVAAGSTQVYQLIKTKRSDELSVPTWSLWLGTQTIALLYMVTLGQSVLIFVNALWVLLYIAILSLILYYRRYPRFQTVAEFAEET